MDQNRDSLIVPEFADKTAFDDVSSNYEELLSKGLSLSGETSDYFAKRRVKHCKTESRKLGIKTNCILDYGCGTGGSINHLFDAFTPNQLIAADVSTKSLTLVENNFSNPKLKTLKIPQISHTLCDLCYCNGVFHHIPPNERSHAVQHIYNSLVTGGFFFLWENNPWNPATHWVMSKIPFDHDAKKIFPHKASHLLEAEGFKIRIVNYLFIFPKLLSILRPLENLFKKLPIGCQYLIIAQKV